MPMRMFLLKQETPVAASPSGGIPGLDKEYGFDVPLPSIISKLLQHPGAIRMGSIIKREEKSALHNAFRCSALLFTTLPVQM